MSKKTTWETTSVQHLLRDNKSGRFYGRWTVAGKQIWRKLDTDVFTVAKLRLADEISKVERLRAGRTAVQSGKGTVADLLQIDRDRTDANTELKPATIAAREGARRKILKTWPGFERLKPNQVTPAAVQAWATRFKATGTNYTPPGATTVIRGNSATSVNRAIDTLRRLMDIALERGAIHTNPVAVKPTTGSLKKKVTRKKLMLPSSSDVTALFAAIEANGSRGGWGVEAADFCRFLAMSGCRIGETPAVSWETILWDRRLVRVRGEKTETSDRIIPLFPELEKLLRSVQVRRKAAARFAVDGKPFLAATDPVFRIKECQKSIDRACATVGMTRLTHHDFRHLFATRCIESGVDIPTVSRWLGHSDGGVLAMATYGHLRQEHSLAQAMKVSFN